MSDETKVKLISAANTFLATFIVAVGASIQNGVEWTTAFWLSCVVMASRIAIKEVINSSLPVRLGGRR